MTEKEINLKIIDYKKLYVYKTMRIFYMNAAQTNGQKLKVNMRNQGIAVGKLLFTLKRFNLLNKD